LLKIDNEMEEMEAEIDTLVFKLCELSDDEIKASSETRKHKI